MRIFEYAEIRFAAITLAIASVIGICAITAYCFKRRGIFLAGAIGAFSGFVIPMANRQGGDFVDSIRESASHFWWSGFFGALSCCCIYLSLRHWIDRKMPLPRFRVRSLLLLVAVFAAMLGWYVSNESAWRHEEKVLAQIDLENKYGRLIPINSQTRFGCGMGLTGVAKREPSWFLNRWAGKFSDADLFERVTLVSLTSPHYDGRSIKLVATLPSLKKLWCRNTSITAEEIDEFKKQRPDVLVEVIEPEK